MINQSVVIATSPKIELPFEEQEVILENFQGCVMVATFKDNVFFPLFSTGGAHIPIKDVVSWSPIPKLVIR